MTDPPDVQDLEVEILQLAHRRDDLRRLHERVRERLLAYPSEHARAEERAVASRLAAIELGMRLLEARAADRRP